MIFLIVQPEDLTDYDQAKHHLDHVDLNLNYIHHTAERSLMSLLQDYEIPFYKKLSLFLIS